jgi:hydroxymethylglutaryl-CoA reductase (NADPH)
MQGKPQWYLSKIKISLAGKIAFLRFVTKTGDAMGMNMISKGVEKSLSGIREYFNYRSR